jgi:hypothetical protein
VGEDGGPQRGVRYLAHHGYLEHSGYLAAFAQTHLKFIRGYEKASPGIRSTPALSGWRSPP